MANIRKQFNFRNGLQVDDDNLIVSPTGLVGIGTTIPTEILDVSGNLKVSGFATASELISPILTISSSATIQALDADAIVATGVSIGNGIIRSSSSGVVTYYGDGGSLLNLPTSQWLDVDAGLGFTSIYSAGNVGVGTTDPRFTFQIGGNNKLPAFFEVGVGIDNVGNILATGIVTASGFTGIGASITQINADNIATGTIATARVPQLLNANIPNSLNLSGSITAASGFLGDLTGDVEGNLVGIASTARDLTSDARVSIDRVVANSSTIGLATVTTKLEVTGSIGIGSQSIIDPKSDLHIRKGSGISSALISSNDSEAYLSLSRGIESEGNAGVLKYGNVDALYTYSGYDDFDIINYGKGNVNTYLHFGEVGINTGSFNWIYGQVPSDSLMTLTYEGNLGIGVSTPAYKLEVNGDVSVSTDLNVIDNVSVGNSITVANLYVTTVADIPGLSGTLVGQGDNLNIISGLSTFYNVDVYGDRGLFVTNNVGIATTQPSAPLQIGQGDSSVSIFTDGIGIGVTQRGGGIGIDARNSDVAFRGVGIGTTVPRCAIDFSDAYKDVDDDYRFLRPPIITNAVRSSITSNNPFALGGIIANSDNSSIEAFDGAEWRRLDTMSSAGIITATGGFSSGTGSPVQISVVGSTLTFNVVGVGSTSLTLY